MPPINDDTFRRPARHAIKPAISLVECTVRVSPALARLIRKCAVAEAGGASAADALLAPAGSRAGEVEHLRDEVEQLMNELGVAHASGTQLKQDVDAAKTALAHSVQERSELERRLNEATAIEEKCHNEMADAGARLADLQQTVTRQEADLQQSISITGLDEAAALAVRTLKSRLSNGDEVREAVLATGGYDPLRVDAAVSIADRDEIRALNCLLARPSWRLRLVLWLLGTKRTPLGER
jgi:hypothetical protein